MARGNAHLIAAALLAAAALWPRKSYAAVNSNSGNFVTVDDWGQWWDMTDPYFPDTVDTGQMQAAQRVAAFLYMLGSAEVGERAMRDGTAYQTFYGGSRFFNLADHPVLTGEKKGVRLPDEWCRRAGFSPGCVSTAAGAYQFTVGTWSEMRAAGAWGARLPDFSPASQDEAARRLLLKIGALPLIEGGDFDNALWRASSRWASLPGSTAGQGGKSYADTLALFNRGLESYSA